ncbi:MAG: hypothetical protein AB7O50_03415 [Pseudolabrys sp.]
MSKTFVAALLAIAALASTTTIPTAADAATGYSRSAGPISHYTPRRAPPRIARPHNPRPPGLHRPGRPGRPDIGRPHRPHHPHWHKHVRYIYVGGRQVAYAPVTLAGPCTCLTKEYTPEGRVLFKDICTNEAAINPPLPVQQTSMTDAQPQAAVPQGAGTYQAQPSNMMPQQPIPQAQPSTPER